MNRPGSPSVKTVLWWGRFDPDYSRNRILRKLYADLGWTVVDFHPWLSAAGDIEALFRRPARANLVHVPCFRQRDLAAAARYARRHSLPLLFDPLISAYDKQVFERGKMAEHGVEAVRLLAEERALFAKADIVLADTTEHARFFAETLGVSRDQLHVVYVGAEESLFMPSTRPHAPNDPLEVLFYGSFIPLQGPQIIIEAARIYEGPPVRWVLLGNGPLRSECESLATGLPNVSFENWVSYQQLPARIHRADILLGVFGATPKARRVMPNKVFQALACGKPLITCAAPAYPAALSADTMSGISWVPAGNARALADQVAEHARTRDTLRDVGQRSRTSYEKFLSIRLIREQMERSLSGIGC